MTSSDTGRRSSTVGIPAPLKSLDLAGQGGWAVRISVLLIVGIWLAHTGFGLPLAIYLLYNYISQLPKDIFESAYIDGATPFTAFTRLVLRGTVLSPCAAGGPSDR
jgi:ABC-type sulfate transport system permease component